MKHQRLNCGCLLKLKSVTSVKPCSNPAPVFNGNGKRGYLRGFYDSIEDPDCCFMCQ